MNELVGELATRREHFRRFRAEHDVKLHQGGGGIKQFRHRVVEVAFRFASAQRRRRRSLVLTCLTAEPGSAADDALKLLASWTAPVAERSETRP